MKKWIWAIVIILVLLTAGMIVGFLLINRYWATSSDRIMWADWLAVACAILSLIGTIFLSCVAILQTDKANQMNDKLFEQNEKLLAQNEELQKMNDYQFKIANQDKIPFLRAVESKMLQPDENTRRSVLRSWQSKWIKRTMVQNQSVARVSLGLAPKNTPPTDVTVLAIILKNESGAVIQQIKTTKIEIYGPIQFEEKRDCNLLGSPLLKDESVGLFLDISHLNDTFPEKKFVQMYIDIELETITGLKFPEKISLFANETGGLASME